MNNSLNILIVENVEDDALLVLKTLQQSNLLVQWQRVDTAEAFSIAVTSQTYDLILCRYRLPQFSAVAALDLCRQNTISIPFIVISDSVREEIPVCVEDCIENCLENCLEDCIENCIEDCIEKIVEVMKAGAHDYVLKSHLTRLPEAVRRVIQDAQSHKQRRNREIGLLQESELRYESLAAAVPVGIFRTDLQGNCLYVNDRWCQIAGLSSEEAMGQGWVRAIHPQDQEFVFREWESSVTQNRPFRLEYRFQRPNGEVIWIYGQSLSEHSRDGELIGYVGSVTDISDRKQAEQELKKLSRIASQTSEGVVINDIHGNVVWVNDAFTRNTGYTLADIKGRKPGVYLQGIDTDLRASQYMRECIRSKRGFSVEILNYTKDCQPFWADLRCSPLLDDNGETEGFIVIQSNITQKKQTEQQLIRAKEAAEAATRAKSAFLAAMSHEIRTPMNGVMGMLTLLEKTQLTDQQRSQVRIAQSSAEALLNIINDILDFSKVEAGKLELEILDFNLADCLENFAHSIALSIHTDDLELILDCQGLDSPWVKGDPGRLRQILMNLVGNAIKFTERGEIVLQANLQPREEGFILEVSVSDTGMGIPADRLHTLFNSFTQVDASITRIHGGTGLGLAICKQLCELMGGDIRVHSEVNVGSCFSFSIPLQASERSSEQASQRSSLDSVPHSQSLQGMKILVVQDNDRSRAVLQRDLIRWGGQVVTTGDASTALTEWRHSINENTPFDLAIVDLNLLDMSGLELVQRLHQDPHFQTHPFRILMLLPVNLPPLEEALSRLGIQTYLRKPFTPNRLHEALLSLTIAPDAIPLLQNAATQTTSIYSPQRADNLALPTLAAHLAIRETQASLLLVEDNPINQAVAQGMIQQLGLNVDIASNGAEAILMMAAANDNPYPLVLMDAQMPVLDGYETTQRIRQGEAGEGHRSVPIIALTAHALMDERERCLQAGMDDYLSKPLHMKRLEMVLNQWLRRSCSLEKDRTMGIESETAPLEPIGEAGLLLFDSEGPLDRCGGHLDLAQMMLQRFLQGIPEGLQTLQQCLQQGDTETIARMAHSMQGSTSMIGAEQMKALLTHIETIAKTGDLEVLRDYIPRLIEHFQALRPALTRWQDH